AGLEGRVQDVVLQAYKRLQSSEEGLLVFVNHLSELTKVEREMSRVLLEGRKVEQIAEARYEEERTIKSQINTLLKKLAATRTKEITNKIRQMDVNQLF